VLLGFGITLDLDLPELAEARAVADSGAAWAASRRRFEDRLDLRQRPGQRRGEDVGRAGRSPAPRVPATGLRLPGPTISAGERALAAFPRRDEEARASDEFVVGPKRSASGRPVLANDPHLGLATPGPLYVLHISVPGVLDAGGRRGAGPAAARHGTESAAPPGG
jgi:acyl-homoserine lactone acylase PvdQ